MYVIMNQYWFQCNNRTELHIPHLINYSFYNTHTGFFLLTCQVPLEKDNQRVVSKNNYRKHFPYLPF